MTTTTVAADPEAALAARLHDPDVVSSLTTLLDHADLLAVLVTGLDQFVARSEVIGDSLVASVQELRQSADHEVAAGGVDVGELLKAGAALAKTLPKAAPGITRAVESGAVDKLMATAEVSAGALDQVDLLARGLVAGSEQFNSDPVKVTGPLSLAKLLRDPDINRALSFFATVAQSVGRELGRPTTS